MSGAILWGVLIRAAIVVLLTLFVVVYLEYRQAWYVSIFVFWVVVVWPAWQQWQRFERDVAQTAEDTICGVCQHFMAESQICALTDQHITAEPSCNGHSFEPAQAED